MRFQYALRGARKHKVLMVKIEGGAFHQYREVGGVLERWYGRGWKNAEEMRKNKAPDWLVSHRKINDYPKIIYNS